MAYWRLFYHITWATADDEPIIEPTWQNSLHNVIADKSEKLGALVYAVGGTKSQIHLAASIPPKLSLSNFIGEIKGFSSHFMNDLFFQQAKFRWQPKFGVVSFNDDYFDFVVKYVRNNHLIKNQNRFLEKCYVRQGQWFLPFWRLYYHFVWRTRLREPLIDPGWEHLLYDAIIQKSEELGAKVHALGGIEDHVHLSVSAPPKMRLSEFIGDVKGYSSFWLNENLSLPYEFNWQSKYGVVSFGGQMLGTVSKYVSNQKEHHKEQKNLIPLWEQTGEAKEGGVKAHV